MGGETSQVTSDGFVAKILAINVYNEFSLRNSPELLSVLQGSTRKGKAGKNARSFYLHFPSLPFLPGFMPAVKALIHFKTKVELHWEGRERHAPKFPH